MMAWTVIHRPSSSAPERVIIILNLYTHTPIYAYKIIWLRRLDGRDHFQTILISLRRRLLHEVKILYTVEAHISLGHHFVVFRPKTITLAFNFVILLFLVPDLDQDYCCRGFRPKFLCCSCFYNGFCVRCKQRPTPGKPRTSWLSDVEYQFS